MPTLNIHLIHNSHSPYFSDVWSRYITELIPPEKIVIYRDPVHWERSSGSDREGVWETGHQWSHIDFLQGWIVQRSSSIFSLFIVDFFLLSSFLRRNQYLFWFTEEAGVIFCAFSEFYTPTNSITTRSVWTMSAVSESKRGNRKTKKKRSAQQTKENESPKVAVTCEVTHFHVERFFACMGTQTRSMQ